MGRQVQSFVAGFVGVALVGAASALLLASRSGQEVRQQLRERSKALQEQAQTVAGEVRVRSQDVLTRGKVLIQSAAEVASQRVQELGHRARPEQPPAAGEPQPAMTFPTTEQPSASAPGNSK